MREYIKQDSWKIIEEGFVAERNESSESLFSLGNGHMGQRANFEEEFSGPSLQGHYVAGIYYPDKTRVGWWKNGYPEYFAKVLNAPSWIGIKLSINEQLIDLNVLKINDFKRILDMQKGILYREFIADLGNGEKIKINSKRFLSLERREIGAIQYDITAMNFSAKIVADLSIDATISNRDSNYDEKFWDPVSDLIEQDITIITSKTRKTDFIVATAQTSWINIDNSDFGIIPLNLTCPNGANSVYSFDLEKNETASIFKIASISTSRDHDPEILTNHSIQNIRSVVDFGFEALEKEHVNAWARKWEKSDIIIEGDLSAQQGIRFNIFQLIQTYTGHDARLNIGPKGFTGEKYGGGTYWDTEAYCLPFYLSTTEQSIPKNLLLYRYNHLDKAILNAKNLGFTNGAALFPMVTMNGEECHNEWEITFEEIHRNGAIAYAIFNYTKHTGDHSYLIDFGIEVLIAISRFWSQRVNYSGKLKKYVMLGVTGPNEYENNVNNNWYTNYIANWTLKYTIEVIESLKKEDPDKAKRLFNKINFNQEKEVLHWETIIKNMYFPEDKELGIFLQQDGYLDKEQTVVSELSKADRPINQNWSWDRILRSCFIKQADVLQGIYFFEDDFNDETIRKNYDFYEARTVHESSLSPCLHVILATKLGDIENAYDLYLRTSRLDLDDYNSEVHEGCHITSMAGTWLSIVEGFGGMRVKEDGLHFNPKLPSAWKSIQFNIHYRGRFVQVNIDHQNFKLKALDNKPFRYFLGKKELFTE